MSFFPKSLFLLLVIFGIVAVPVRADLPWPRVKYTEVATVQHPVHVAHAGDGSGRLFVVALNGTVHLVKNRQLQPNPFLDIADRVLTGGERGLLSIAFPPGYTTKRYFYVCYSRKSDGAVVLSRFRVPQSSPDRADAASEEVLLDAPHPNENHLGGQIAFGPDGYLYWGIGDGGSQGDPSNNSQNPNLLLGKLLRLDTETKTIPYLIPPTNPFVGRTEYRPEILALGLRNPWRFSFDRQTGALYLPDVGQNAWEEVNIIPAGSNGGQNFGWRILEGNHPYNLPSGFDTSKLSPPAFEYSHQTGMSITGGFVYRGPPSGLTGFYVYADFMSQKIMASKQTPSGWVTQTLDTTRMAISSFGEDQQGRLYAADYYTGKVVEITEELNVRAPVLSSNGGTFSNAVTVSASVSPPDAVLRYTTNKMEPTLSDRVFPASGLIMNRTKKLRVKGFHSSLLPSATTTADFRFFVADPTIAAESGPIFPEVGKSVRPYTITQNAAVHYTLDGSLPTAASAVFRDAIGIHFAIGPATVRAVAFKPGYAPSKVVSASWVRPTLATPILSSTNFISISGLGDIHYTLNGTSPTVSSPLYTHEIPITRPELLRARSYRYGYYPSFESSVNLVLSYVESAGSGGASGSGEAGFADSSLFYKAQYRSPEAVCMNGTAGYLVADTGNHAIRQAAFFGPVSTLAGDGTAGYINAAGNAARFSSPRGICRDAAGNVYVADDGNHVIRKIDSAGNVTTYAGSGASGTTNGPANQAKFLDLQSLTIDASGNLFAGSLGIIRKIDTVGIVSNFATLPNAGRVTMAITPQGRMFATDSSDKVYEISASGITSLFAGGISGYSDGFRSVARFQNNRSVNADALGILYVCDGDRVRKIRPDGNVLTGWSFQPGYGLSNLAGPRGLAVGLDGVAWVADTGNHRIGRLQPNDWERDGIPDSLEGGMTPFVVGVDDRLVDTDSDGQSNFVEYAGGSDPRAGGSRFEIKNLIQNGNGTVVIQWQSVVGSLYSVEYTDDLKTWTPIEGHNQGTGGLMSVSHNKGNQKQCFFRITAVSRQ